MDDDRSVGDVPRGLLVAGEWVESGAGAGGAGAGGGGADAAAAERAGAGAGARAAEHASAGGRPVLEVRDPYDGAPLARLPSATAADAVRAMEGAAAGFAGWSRRSPRERADVLHRAHALVAAREWELARLITLEMGKPLAESVAEVRYANGFVREYAELATRIEGRSAPRADGSGRLRTAQEPVGVAVVVTPWNFPLAMVARKLAPALAAGCAAVVKPADLTPLSALAFAAILLEAGVEPAAVSVLPTTDSPAVVRALLDHDAAAKLSFTGSTGVGRALAAHAGGRLLRMSLELGGNAPFVVFADADLGAAVDAAMAAKFRNGGQACTAANRFLVEAPVVDEFAERLAVAASGMQVGHGLDPVTTLGPLISPAAATRVRGLVEDAVARGAAVLTGGEAADSFVPATVLTGVPLDARVWREEIFGPVAAIASFSGEAQALALANDTRAGLAAYVCTREAGRLERVSDGLRAGMVGANTGVVSDPAAPFGGIGDSGYGREGGLEGLGEYLQTRYVAVGA